MRKRSNGRTFNRLLRPEVPGLWEVSLDSAGHSDASGPKALYSQVIWCLSQEALHAIIPSKRTEASGTLQKNRSIG